MVHRGQQYVRAIRRYYRKFGRYPSKIQDLNSRTTSVFSANAIRTLWSRMASGRFCITGKQRTSRAVCLVSRLESVPGIGGSTPGVNTVGGTPAGALGGVSEWRADQPQTSDNGGANSSVSTAPLVPRQLPGTLPDPLRLRYRLWRRRDHRSGKPEHERIVERDRREEPLQRMGICLDPRVEALAGGAGQAGQAPVQQKAGKGSGKVLEIRTTKIRKRRRTRKVLSSSNQKKKRGRRRAFLSY